MDGARNPRYVIVQKTHLYPFSSPPSIFFASFAINSTITWNGFSYLYIPSIPPLLHRPLSYSFPPLRPHLVNLSYLRVISTVCTCPQDLYRIWCQSLTHPTLHSHRNPRPQKFHRPSKRWWGHTPLLGSSSKGSCAGEAYKIRGDKQKNPETKEWKTGWSEKVEEKSEN